MPRKATKIEKSPLLFVERPLCGARLQNVPEVRAALNPKEFFTETQAHNSPALCSWVSPQFDSSVVAAPPLRRGRRKCQSATSILDGCSQLSRKNRNQPRGSCQIKKTVSSAQYLDTPKRQSTSIRRRSVERFSDGATSSSRCLDQPKTCSLQGKRCRLPADSASTPASSEFRPSEFSSVGPPPDVDTPKVIQEGSSCVPSPIMHLLLAEPCTPPCNQPPDILVADTPERDYGLKVTWRRRMGLMLLLKDRGHLSDSDVLIQS
uniref:RAD9-HUS1-RAD1 interacting nuclear orphan 1 n=1 Tax=Seriola dumerili TaxID=41447 RepID=A0A3B4V546_SERDU